MNIDFIKEMPKKESKPKKVTKVEVKKSLKKVEKAKEKTVKMLSKDIVKERHLHWNNEGNLSAIAEFSKEVFCPVCARDGSNIRFTCHPEKSLDEIAKEAQENFNQSTEREEIDKTFINLIKKVIVSKETTKKITIKKAGKKKNPLFKDS